MAEYLSPDDYKIAEANGIPEHRAKVRFYELGWSKHRAITQECKRPKGLWPKWKDKCAENGISQTTFFNRIKQYGVTPEKAATTPPLQKWGWTKKVHVLTPELRETAAKNGISKGALNYRVYGLKWPVERAITEPINASKRKKGWK